MAVPTLGDWSPSVGNLLIGKGFCLFKPVGAAAFYHMGNIPALSLTPKTTLLDHFDSQAGTKTKDLTIVTEKSLELKLDMEEFTANNLAMLMLGTVDRTDPLRPIVNIFATNSLSGHFQFYAANDVGPRWYVDIPSVTFNPSGDFSPISDSKFAVMSVTGSVNVVTGLWGTAQQHPPVGTIAPENILAPYITSSDDVALDALLTCEVGGWIGATSFTYLWKVGGTTPAGTPINEATYQPTGADVSKTVTCAVSGTNAIGTTGPVTTAAVGPVLAY